MEGDDMTLMQWILWALAFCCVAADSYSARRKCRDTERMLHTANYELQRTRSILVINEQIATDQIWGLQCTIERLRREKALGQAETKTPS